MRLLVLGILLGGIVASLTTSPRFIVASDNDRIVNRAVVWQVLDASVALYSMTPTSPPRERFFCGGTLLSPTQVLTAFHCVAGGRDWYVRTHDGKSIGAVIEKPCVECDLALLKLAQSAQMKPAMISADIAPGDEVWHVGSPFGYPFTPTWGHIAEIMPKWKFDNCPDDRKDVGTKVQQVIRSDVRTFFGNSGGGLFDDRGNLIGVAVRLETPGEDCSPYLGEAILFDYSVGPLAIRDFLGEVR